jgi:hypothetical protein
MSQIKDYLSANKEQLDLYTEAITRAHGRNHPEVFEVRDIYVDIDQKVANGDENLTADFAKLTKITNNYAIPSDVCPVFKATYHSLEEMNQLIA